LDNRVNSQIDKINENKVRYNKWFIKKVEFSNFLSFGKNNSIDFTELNGISVIESNPRNFGGKSTSSVDLLMFLFFNATTKTKTNGEIFNKFTDDDEVIVKGYLTIDGENYVISRTLTRKKSRSGEYTVKSDLEFYKEKEIKNKKVLEELKNKSFETKDVKSDKHIFIERKISEIKSKHPNYNMAQLEQIAKMFWKNENEKKNEKKKKK
jgi:hypothetical protein